MTIRIIVRYNNIIANVARDCMASYSELSQRTHQIADSHVIADTTPYTDVFPYVLHTKIKKFPDV